LITVNIFLPVKEAVPTSLDEYFSATVFSVLHGSCSTQLWSMAIFEHTTFHNAV